MAGYDPYERDYSRRYVREERREDPRYYEPREATYSKHTTRELIPRERENSDLSVEEIHRDFPPPQGRAIGRARSAEPRYVEDEYEYRRSYDPRYERDHDRRSRRSPTSTYYDDDDPRERKPKHKGMSKQDKIIAAVAGAALLAGGKELYDRHEAKEGGGDIQRNVLSSFALAGVGALAAYQGAEFYSKQQAKKDQKANYILHGGRDGYEYPSDEDEGPKEKKSHKKFLESALAATGLGAAVKSLTGGGGDDSRSDTRSRRGGSPTASTRSQSRGGSTNKIQKAAMASLLAGATEAFRVSKEPGSWKGEKAKRILTAAAGAATVDAATGPDKGKLGLAESVIGGLVGNRLINGSKNEIEEDKKTGRSRSRSRARSQSGGGGGTGLAALATAGLGALGAKKVYDRSRSRGRSESSSRSPDRRRERSRSRSVVDKARNSLAKLGIGAGAGAGAEAIDESRRRDQDDYSERGSRRPRRYSDDMYDDDYSRGSRDPRDRRDDYDDDRSYRSSKPRDRERRRGGRSDYDSESDLGHSSDDERRAKKMKGKQILTTGLAAVATIHAAHEVYESIEKRNARQKAVKEGRLSEQQAKKLKTKAIMQDAASVGIAAMGIKGAISGMKEAHHQSKECKEFRAEKAHRHERRLQKRRGQPNPQSGKRRADSWAPQSRSPYPHDGYDSEDSDDPRFYQTSKSRTLGGPIPPPPIRGR